MKSFATFILLLTFLTVTAICFGQKKDTFPPISDSTPLLTIKDVNELDALLRKTFTVDEINKYQEVLKLMEKLVAIRANEYNLKAKKLTNK